MVRWLLGFVAFRELLPQPTSTARHRPRAQPGSGHPAPGPARGYCPNRPHRCWRMKNMPSGPFAWRMKTHGCPEETNMHHARPIHRQCLDGCPSYDRFAKGVSAIVTPVKMSVPALLSGVEQSHAASCLGVLPCDVRTLRVVAHRARVAQVVQFGLTTHRSRNNVVDFERFG